ncbi:MAG: SDR family NAD(P)-dependent oxidoreductase [Clostridiales bacterium]|jgi:short-subunit dehydrogenase|nr:SDR family NAD(P)-dependent oxidoreductase [Clostridiales bacterium]
MPKIVIVTGASAGIGKATAELFAKKGEIVYNVSRTPSNLSGVRDMCADVSNYDALKDAIERIYASEKQIDVLINCAGMGISGSVESTPPKKLEKIFAVNFFGTAYASQLTIPYMRKKGRGAIINVGSVAGVLPIPFQAFYSATKAAVSSFGNALSQEVKPFGITVSTVLPGDVKTEFTSRREKNSDDDASYGERIKKSVEKMERDEQNGLPASLVAERVYKLSKKKNPPIYTVCGKAYSAIVTIAKLLPDRLTAFIIGKLYG